MSALGDDVLDFLAARGKSVATAATSIGDKNLLHALREVKKHQLSTKIGRNPPSLLASPESIYWDLHKPGLVCVLEGSEVRGKIIVLIDYRAKKILTNTVRTERRTNNLKEFENCDWYKSAVESVRGEYATLLSDCHCQGGLIQTRRDFTAAPNRYAHNNICISRPLSIFLTP